MRLIDLLAVATLTAVTCGPESTEPLPQLPARIEEARTVAITHVDVIPMRSGDTDEILRDQTVVVRDGRIAAVGAGTAVPSDAVTVDGRGRFLAPGLIDAHTHIRYTRDLIMYVAGGVTTVFTLGQAPTVEAMRARADVERGAIPGPRVFAAVFLDGPASPIAPIADVQGVRSAVQSARANGNDFVKLYNSLTPEQFEAAVSEARLAGLPVIGHAVRSMPLPYALTHGQQVVAHAEEYLYTFFEDREDDSKLAEAARFTKVAGAYVIPNLSAYDIISRQWGNPDYVRQLEAQPEFRLLHPDWQARWRNSDYVRRPGSLGTRPQFLRRLTRALSEAGVPLMAGTDSPGIPGAYPGSFLSYDLETLVDAGLSSGAALRAATRTPGLFLEANGMLSEPVGRIEVGARADLILLDANPLVDIRNIRRIAGVMKKGGWYSAAELLHIMMP